METPRAPSRRRRSTILSQSFALHTTALMRQTPPTADLPMLPEGSSNRKLGVAGLERALFANIGSHARPLHGADGVAAAQDFRVLTGYHPDTSEHQPPRPDRATT